MKFHRRFPPPAGGLRGVGGERLLGEDSILFAGTEAHGLFQSRDGGQSWQRLAADSIHGPVDAILFSPDYPSKPDLLALANGELLISGDGGETWRPKPGSNIIDQPLTTVLAPTGLDDGAPLLVGIVNHGVTII